MLDEKIDQLEPAFRKALDGKEPYEHQVELGQKVLVERNAVPSAGTGSGKTEAALVPALLTDKRVLLLYPTKALLQDQFGRVEEIAEAILNRRPRIAVNTGDEDDLSYYHADIILTNLDRFLYRMFGYAKKRYS